MMANDYLKTFLYGVKTCSTSAIQNGIEHLREYRAILKKMQRWEKSLGLHLRLLWLHTLNLRCVRKCIRLSTGQRLLKISQPKKSGSSLECQNATSCSNYSIKGELPTQQQRLLDKGWVK